MDKRTDNDFQIHTDPPVTSRELEQAQQFLKTFLDGYGSTSTQTGFPLAQILEKQDDDQSCFFASAMATARALGLTKLDFLQTVQDMTAKGQA